MLQKFITSGKLPQRKFMKRSARRRIIERRGGVESGSFGSTHGGTNGRRRDTAVGVSQQANGRRDDYPSAGSNGADGDYANARKTLNGSNLVAEPAPVVLPPGVSPRTFADHMRALREPSVSVAVYQNEHAEAASAESVVDPRVLLARMVAHVREPANYNQQVEAGEVFAETNDELDALLATGLHDRLMKQVGKLKEESTSYDLSLEISHEVFKEIGHGIALAELLDEEVLLTSEHVADLNKVAAAPEEGITSPDGFIVDKDGKIVLVYATVLLPYQSIVNDTITGMREFVNRFKDLCGGEGNTPQLLLISPKPKRVIELSPDVVHKQVPVLLDEIVDYARDNIFDEVSPMGRKTPV